MIEPIPPEALLEGYPEPMREIARTLRTIVRRAVPDAVERVRTGWRLIGYDAPAGSRTVYFCFVAPEPGHVHLGFEYGVFMTDPDLRLLGDVRQVRWLTFRPGDPIDPVPLEALIREARRVALLGRSGRLAAVLDGPDPTTASRRSRPAS